MQQAGHKDAVTPKEAFRPKDQARPDGIRESRYSSGARFTVRGARKESQFSWRFLP